MSAQERLARVALSALVEPGHRGLAEAVARDGAEAVWHALRAGRPVPPLRPELVAAAAARAGGNDPEADVEALVRCGGRLLCPQDEEWPAERLSWPLDVLPDAPPLALYLRGPAPLAASTRSAVGVVGARAATAYGAQVARELGLGLAQAGVTVVSGGAYGIDGAAHAGALSASGSDGSAPTLAVLASGVDVLYPRGNDRLLQRVAAEGLLVSEVPPGWTPTRARFLVRNRLIAALSSGTVVVEAALRSGSLCTASRAEALSRPVMAVPGPVTSAASAGCHARLREGALCVTGVADVLEAVGRPGEHLASPERGAPTPRDALSATVRAVLDAVPVRTGAGEAGIARAAGVPPSVVLQVLPPLLVAGLVERCEAGWRLTPLGAGRPLVRRCS